MKFFERNYENISLDCRFIRAIGVQLNIKSEPGEWKKDVIQIGMTLQHSALSPPDAF